VTTPVTFMRDDVRRDASVTIAEVAAVIAAVTFVVMLVSLFVGGKRYRTTRMWLVFTAISCGWLGFTMTGPEIYWYGQQRRVRAHIPAAEILLKRLQADWPKADGEIAGLGPFQAYPVNRPTALVPLRMMNLIGTSQQFTLVERSATGVIRIELGGNELGAWLEWRPDDSPPETFAGGLGTQYNMRRYARLAPHWFLVRYQRSSNSLRHVPIDPGNERARGGVAIHNITPCPISHSCLSVSLGARASS